MTDQSSRLPQTQYDSGKRAKLNPHSTRVAKSNSSKALPSYGLSGMANLPCRLKPRQRGIRVALISSSAAQAAFLPACPAAHRIAIPFTNDLRSMPVIPLEISCDTTRTICLRWRSYFEFIFIDQMAPGLMY